MNRLMSSVLAVPVAFLAFQANAADLSFPKSAQEIVDALSLKDGAAEFQGVQYESKQGKVYKVIRGRRYRVRGLAGITDAAIVPKAGALVQFHFDSAAIKPESYAILDEFGKALRGPLSDAVLLVGGHTDAKGNEGYNLALSEKRAESVKKYLVRHHDISADRLQAKAFGESKPIASNATEDGQAKNRRVEFLRVE